MHSEALVSAHRSVNHGTASVADIQKRYKKLALQYHPDKAGASAENIDRFQEATTAYSVLNSEESRSAYWEMYKLRCYLHQGPAAEDLGQALAPFYVFHVRKQEKTGLYQERMLSLDLVEGCIQNWKKDEAHRQVPLEVVVAVAVVIVAAAVARGNSFYLSLLLLLLLLLGAPQRDQGHQGDGGHLHHHPLQDTARLQAAGRVAIAAGHAARHPADGQPQGPCAQDG